MERLFEDVRYGLRTLLTKPGFTIIAVLTLALGIGANTAIFSAVNALLLRPLPVEEAEQLVFGFALREGFDPFGTSLLEYAAYREQSQSFTGSGVASQRFFNLVEVGEPERLKGAAVMADYLSTLGVKPIAGRAFTAQEDQPGGEAVLLVSYDLWQRRFGGDSKVIGRQLNVEDRSFTVIGVMPPGFNMPYACDVWVPLQTNMEALPLEQRAQTAYEMIARLRPGVAIEQADAELKGFALRLEQEYPQIRRGWSYRLVPLRQQLISDLEGRTQRALFALIAAVGFLLLICCANVASLLLVRGVAREREIAIRLALGAGRGRVVRQLFTESMLLAIIGGLAGLVLAYWLLPLLATLNPVRAVSLATFLGDFHIDARVLGFCLLSSLMAGAIFGLVPALKIARSGDLMTVIKQREQRSGGSAAGRRWLGALVVCEIAAAAILLVGGGLMVQSFQRLQKIDLGFRPDNLLMIEMALSPNKYNEHRRRVAFVKQVLNRVRALPGVLSAGTTTNVPLQAFSFDSVFTVEGRPPANPADVPITAHRLVSPDYLEALGVTLVKGRLVNEQDHAESLPVVVISEELARQAWPDDDPLGKRIRRGRPAQTDRTWLTVVGVVSDIKEDRFNFRVNRAAWYLPYAQQEAVMPLNLVARASGDPASLTAAIRDAILSIDPAQPISNVTTMEAHLSGVLVTERFSAILMTALAAFGLVLGSLGLYGVISYSVSQRTVEIGLRMALGASPRDILKMVIGQGLLLVAMGLGAGLLAAHAIMRTLSGTLYGVSPTDPATFVLVALLLSSVALLACYVPARRAIRIDPMIAIRHE